MHIYQFWIIAAATIQGLYAAVLEDVEARGVPNTCAHGYSSHPSSIGPYTCAPTVKPPQDRRTMQICGRQGIVKYGQRLLPSPFTVPELANCSQACIENIACLSLSWTPANGTCLLSPNRAINEDFIPGKNGVEHYHVHCFGQDCSCPSGTSQILLNPSFETGVPGVQFGAANWTFGGDPNAGLPIRFHKEERADVRCYDGAHYIIMSGPATFISQNLSCLIPGNTYTVSFYYNVLAFESDPTFNLTATMGSAAVTFAAPFYISPDINEESYAQALGTFVAAEQSPVFTLTYQSTNPDALAWPSVSLDFFSICA